MCCWGMIGGFAIFILVILFGIFYLDKVDESIFDIVAIILLLLASILMVVSALTLVIYTVMSYFRKNNKQQAYIFFTFWKQLQMLGIAIVIFVTILGLAKGNNIIVTSWQNLYPNMPVTFFYVIMFASLILSILVIIGITKRIPLGYYTLIGQLTIFLIQESVGVYNRIGNRDYNGLHYYIIPLLLYTTLAYFLIKEKSYFFKK